MWRESVEGEEGETRDREKEGNRRGNEKWRYKEREGVKCGKTENIYLPPSSRLHQTHSHLTTSPKKQQISASYESTSKVGVVERTENEERRRGEEVGRRGGEKRRGRGGEKRRGRGGEKRRGRGGEKRRGEEEGRRGESERRLGEGRGEREVTV